MTLGLAQDLSVIPQSYIENKKEGLGVIIGVTAQYVLKLVAWLEINAWDAVGCHCSE
jgi:hypothetical protein